MRTNGGVRCDVTSGPCACGAWHEDRFSIPGESKTGNAKLEKRKVIMGETMGSERQFQIGDRVSCGAHEG